MKYFACYVKKVSCVISIFKFKNAFIVYPHFHTYSKDTEIEFEERVDNAIYDLYKLHTLPDEADIIELLPEEYKFTTRILRQDVNIDWKLLWNKMFDIFK
jgi:hypothetical protein